MFAAIVCVAFGFLAMVALSIWRRDDLGFSCATFFLAFVAGLIFGAWVCASVDTLYYEPAEVVAYGANLVLFETDDGEIFAAEVSDNMNYPDTYPYLLYMEGWGTNDVKDDQIISVWRCTE